MAVDLVALGERIAEHAAHLDAAMHRLLTDLREFDRGGGWAKQGARSCAHWLSWRVGWDLGTAREHVRVAGKLAELPEIDRSLQCGELSYSKVRAITRTATPANEHTLLELARLSTAQQLETICRKYAAVQRHGTDPSPADDRQRRYVRRSDTVDGMVRIEAVLHPEEAAIVWAALDQAAKQIAGASTDAAPGAAAWTREAHSASAEISRSCELADAAAVTREAHSASAETSRPHESAAAAVLTREAHSASAETSRSHESAAAAGTRELPDASAETSLSRERQLAAAVDRTVAPSRRLHTNEPPGCSPAGRAPSGALANRFDRADALLALAQGWLRGTSPNRSPVEVVLTVEAASLRADAASRHTQAREMPHVGEPLDPSAIACFQDSTCVSAETARRLGCDAGVVIVEVDERGHPLSVGRKTRTIPAALKRALLHRDRTCRFPGCTNRLYLEGHHLQHWADGGETSLSNTCLLCTRHHHFVHEYGYSIINSPDGPQFRDSHGRPVVDVPPSLHLPDLGWPAILTRNEPFWICPETNESCWDGTRVDYVEIIEQLARADELHDRSDRAERNECAERFEWAGRTCSRDVGSDPGARARGHRSRAIAHSFE